MISRLIPFLFLLIIPISGVFSQDFHYSQFYNEPLNFNPSFTGAFKGDKRMIFSLRDQYRSVKVPYFTISGNYDMKFLPKTPKKGYFSGGVVFNYDKQGSSRISLFNLNATASYIYFINNKHSVAGGLLLGFANRGFSEDDLRWDNNWNSTTNSYDKRLASGEHFESFRFSFLETGLGLNYKYQPSTRTSFTIGASAFHVNTPSLNFYSTDADNLDMRFSLIGIANIKLAQSLDFQPSIMYQQQDVYKEIVLGGLAKIYLNSRRGKELAVHLGLIGRLGEGLAPKLAIAYNQWYVGMNYDIVTKDNLSEYTNYRGGPEVHVRYIITDIKPLKDFKICPIY